MKTFLKKNRKWIINLLFFGVLAGLTFFFLFKDNELSDLAAAVKNTNGLWLIGGLLAMLAFLSFEALNIRMLMKTLAYRPGFVKCLKFAFIDFYYSAITPGASGGQPAQICYMKREGIEVGSSSLALLMFNVTYHMGVLLICGAALLYKGGELFAAVPLLKYFAAFGGLVHLFLTGVFLTAILKGQWLRKAAGVLIGLLARMRLIKEEGKALEKVEAQMMEYQHGAAYIKKHPLLLCRTFLFTLLHLLSLYSVPIFVYQAFGLSGMGPVTLIALQAILTLSVESLPLPGGMGAAEKGFLMVYGSMFGPALILPATLLCRGINYYSFLIVGGIVTAITHGKRKVMVERVFPESAGREEPGVRSRARRILKGRFCGVNPPSVRVQPGGRRLVRPCGKAAMATLPAASLRH